MLSFFFEMKIQGEQQPIASNYSSQNDQQLFKMLSKRTPAFGHLFHIAIYPCFNLHYVTRCKIK